MGKFTSTRGCMFAAGVHNCLTWMSMRVPVKKRKYIKYFGGTHHLQCTTASKFYSKFCPRSAYDEFFRLDF